MKRHFSHCPGRFQQRGYALLLMLVMVTMGLLFSVVSQVSLVGMKWGREQRTSDALVQAKEALIGYAATYGDMHSGQVSGYLPCPDMNGDGSADALDADCGGTDGRAVIGLLPYKQLGLPSNQDADGTCLWYAVSGTLKASTNKPTPMNWDTQGQIEVRDANSIIITTPNDASGGAAAVVFSVGPAISSQSRLAGTASAPCGISAPPKANASYANYIDVDLAGIDIARSQPFPGATNGTVRVTQGTVGSSINNDQILAITPKEIFSHVIARNDFANQIAAMLDDPDLRKQVEIQPIHPETIAVSGSGTKGADNINCNVITNPTNRAFCKNWKEMLFLTQLPLPNQITIDSALKSSCNRVLIFAGRKTGAQVRNSALDKANPSNYLEEPNMTAFHAPTANSANFSGTSSFDRNNPGTDLLRCLP